MVELCLAGRSVPPSQSGLRQPSLALDLSLEA
jgi:hypothetical protein